MKSFREFILESSIPPGNYVSIKAVNPGDIFEEMHILSPKSGTKPPDNDYHVTLMYSKNSNENIDRIQDVLQFSGFNKEYCCNVVAADCFGDSENPSMSCLVLKLECDDLHKMHDFLKSFKLVHSFPNFEPHITLLYKMDTEEAYKYKELINTSLETGNWSKCIILHRLKSETINRYYV